MGIDVHAQLVITIFLFIQKTVFCATCSTGFIENKLSNKVYCCSYICENKESPRYNLAWCCQSTCRTSYQEICNNISTLPKKSFLSKPFQLKLHVDPSQNFNKETPNLQKLITEQSVTSDNAAYNKLKNIYIVASAIYIIFIVLATVIILYVVQKCRSSKLSENDVTTTMIKRWI